MPVTREKIDTSFEDKLLIGLVTSTNFIRDVSPIFQSNYIESSFGRVVSNWCFDYFDKYQKAPGIHIEDLFDAHGS